jgi:hypothetical protein
MSCDHDCARPPAFPKPIRNRAGLDTIDYRIGDYGSMSAHILSLIDDAPELRLWTHRRAADDPGIALAESAAIVGDILAFYQHIYANEAFLRTAKWRESVSDLVRVLGYRLAPGLGGVARFAIAVKGERPVRIPAGFAITAELPSAPKPATFETSAAFEAVPALSKFRLYRPRSVPPIADGDTTFQVLGDVALAAGDRILVGTEAARALLRSQMLSIDATWESFGVRFVRTRGRIACLRGDTADRLRAYKIVASAPHAGGRAPATRIAIGDDGHATEETVGFHRSLDAEQGDPASPALTRLQLPLEGTAADFPAGTLVVVEADISAYRGAISPSHRVQERSIVAVRDQTFGWGAAGGEAAMVELDAALATVTRGGGFGYADIRSITAHAVEGASFQLRAAPIAAAAGDGNVLEYYGRREDASALAQRLVLLALPDAPVLAKVTAVGAGPVIRSTIGFFSVTLDRPVDYSLFPYETPRVDVYGNLAEATEGKTEAEVAIGDGDARAIFQTFPLPKAPLTYLLDAASPTPREPQLEVWVERVKWRRVESFFGAGSADTVYIVREGDDGRSFVQFGDGRTGARLPSGRGNVVARFRTGTGAHGLAASDKKPSATRKVPGFDDVWMLQAATIGCAPETAAGARDAAPATMQSLGRIVSLADYEAEALALPGVLKARAAWTSIEGLSEITVTILTASGTQADATAIEIALRRALAARGPARCPLRVRAGVRRAIRVRLAVAYDELRRQQDIAEAIASALGVEDDDPSDDVDPRRHGLMHWRMRNFGDGVHGSQVLGAVQNVAGVAWAKLEEMSRASGRVARPALHIPLLPILATRASRAPERASLNATPQEMLSLSSGDLSMSFVPVAAGAAPA